MEVSIVDISTIRVKGKKIIILVDPKEELIKSGKVTADIVCFMSETAFPITVSPDAIRLVTQGPGEYEVGGAKITGVRVSGELVYLLRIDSMDVCLAPATAMQKVHENLKECDLVLFSSNSTVNESVITALAPKVTVLYGKMASDTAKALKDTTITPVKKVQYTAEKLPAEMEIVVLG